MKLPFGFYDQTSNRNTRPALKLASRVSFSIAKKPFFWKLNNRISGRQKMRDQKKSRKLVSYSLLTVKKQFGFLCPRSQTSP